MNCEKCGQPIDPGATFCGNCGQPVAHTAPTAAPAPSQTVVSQVMANGPTPTTPAFSTPSAGVAGGGAVAMPSYATQPVATGNKAEVLGIIGLIVGILGIPGSLIPILGLALGITGVVLSTISRSKSKRLLSLLGIIFSCLAILTAIAAFTYAVEKNAHNNAPVASTGASSNQSSSAVVSTPCYSFDRIHGMGSNTQINGCAFTTTPGTIGTVDFDVGANYSAGLTAQNLSAEAMQGYENMLNNSEFKNATKPQKTTFAGSPAYEWDVQAPTNNEYLLNAVVYNTTYPHDNLYVIVYGQFGSQPTSFGAIESSWQWK